MKATGFLILDLIALMSLGAIDATYAEDFTFHVPVKFSSIDRKVKKVTVHCSVFAEGPTRLASVAVPIPVPEDGTYSGRVVLTLDVANPSQVKRWSCFFQLFDGARTKFPNSPGLTWTRAKRGTPLVTEVTGVISEGGPG